MKRTPSKSKSIRHVELHPEVSSAILTIQCAVRRTLARERVVKIVRGELSLVFDDQTRKFFYFDHKREQATWEKPKILRTRQLYADGKTAGSSSIRIQTVVRRKLARSHVRELLKTVVKKGYDPESGDFFFHNSKTQDTTWHTPSHYVAQLTGDSLELDYESKMLLAKDEEIQKLKKQLETQEKEIERTKEQRLHDLQEETRSKKLVEALRGAPRSKDMDEWTVEHVAAWIGDMEQLERYAGAFVANRIDGLLLLNLDNEDLEELGIKSKLHQRRLNLALKKYKVRWEKKQEGEEVSDGEDDGSLGSETPSELLEEDVGITSSEEESEGDSDDELLPTEEELIEMRQDRENINVTVKFEGNGTDFPKYGDIVRCHYTMSIQHRDQEEPTIVESTRNWRHKPMEFVLGAGQIVDGVERALMKMSLMERSTIKLTSLYAFGEEGVPPLIPPNTPVEFDLELVGIRRKPIFRKQMIQPPGFSVIYPEEPGKKRVIEDYDHVDSDSSSRSTELLRKNSF